MAEHSVEQLQELEKRIQKGEHLRIQAQTKLEGLETQRKETEEELKSMGVDPSKAQAEIEKLEKEMAKQISEIEALLPSDELDTYR